MAYAGHIILITVLARWSARQSAHPRPVCTCGGPVKRSSQASCARSDRGSSQVSRRSHHRCVAPRRSLSIPARDHQRARFPLSDRAVPAALLSDSCSANPYPLRRSIRRMHYHAGTPPAITLVGSNSSGSLATTLHQCWVLRQGSETTHVWAARPRM